MQTDLASDGKKFDQDKVYLAISLTSLGLLFGGRIAPLLYPLGLLTQIVAVYPFIIAGVRALLYERRITLSVIDMIVAPGMFLAGYTYAGATAIVLIFLSKVILKKTEDHSKQNMANLFGDLPSTVWVIVEGQEVRIPLEQLQTGERIVVHAGGIIPVDGVIVGGICTVDQRMLTGESQPIEKEVGDSVLAATTLLAGRVEIAVENAGAETTAAQITTLLTNTADFKLNVQSRAEALGDRFAPLTFVLGTVAWPLRGVQSALALFFGGGLGYNMRFSAPLSMLNALTIALRSGILVKDARSFDFFKNIDTVVFDKTGTLTVEQPHVGEIYVWNENHGMTDDTASSEQVLIYAAAAESQQSHPIAKAILAEARGRNLTLPPIDNSRYAIGFGLYVVLSANTPNNEEIAVHVGSRRFMEMEGIEIPADAQTIQTKSQQLGYSLVMVAINQQFRGMIELVPTIRPEASNIIQQLQAMGMDIYVISGDQETPTQTLAEELSIEHYFANTLPEQKAEYIQQLQEEGRTVCFIGDGINDTVALKQADVSVSMSGASSIATDAAQIILMDASLSQFARLFKIADSFERNMQVNLWMTAIPSLVCIGGVYFLHFGIISAIALYNIGLVASVVNSMRLRLQSVR
ncbi:MAG: heavy metal translocating P-type ATPase [Chloroflexota bacterium]